jgi:NAD(P)-dependent dehydrogenase (short-subunit alcohol dehydrogenase family)
MKNLGVGVAPLNRPGMPIEIATAYVFLASPYGSYFTGEVIHGTGTEPLVYYLKTLLTTIQEDSRCRVR